MGLSAFNRAREKRAREQTMKEVASEKESKPDAVTTSEKGKPAQKQPSAK